MGEIPLFDLREPRQFDAVGRIGGQVMALAGENTAGSSVSERAGSGCWAVKALQGVFKRVQERAAGDR